MSSASGVCRCKYVVGSGYKFIYLLLRGAGDVRPPVVQAGMSFVCVCLFSRSGASADGASSLTLKFAHERIKCKNS